MEVQKSEKRVRRSIQELQADFESGKNNQLVLLIKAFAAIQKESLRDLQKKLLKEIEGIPDELDFFGRMAGIHGFSFIPGSSFYCEHQTVLFPIWHRAYLFTLEEGLRSIPGCENVTLPYWDPFYKDPNPTPVPWVFTQRLIDLKDGNGPIKNPLYSYKFPYKIDDKDLVEAKPLGYETVRYPLSGLAGNKYARDFSEDHNKMYESQDSQVRELNLNFNRWLDGASDYTERYGIRAKYEKCLKEESYYYFSHRPDKPPTSKFIVPLESPHDQVHMSVGGFAPDFTVQNDLVKQRIRERGPDQALMFSSGYETKEHSFGDMQFVSLAAFDPIFWFHHCYVDFVFWKWQKDHNQMNFKDLVIKAEEGPYKQKQEEEARQDLKRPLEPFLKKDGTFYYSVDCTNPTDLGFEYEEPAQIKSFASLQAEPADSNKVRLIVVENIDRSSIKGPFIVQVRHEKTRKIVWEEAVFNRMTIKSCKTCQENLIFGFSFPYRLRDDEIDLDQNTFRLRFEVSLAGQARKKANESKLLHANFEAEQVEITDLEKNINDVVVTLGDFITL